MALIKLMGQNAYSKKKKRHVVFKGRLIVDLARKNELLIPIITLKNVSIMVRLNDKGA